MATTPRNIRFDDDLYKEIKAISKRPLTAAYHIQEACRQYLKQNGKPVVTSNNVPIIKKVDDDQFEGIWIAYGKKGNKKTSKAKFNKLDIAVKHLIYDHIPNYVLSTPDKQYRKNLETYINQECWNDEIVKSSAPDQKMGAMDNLTNTSWANHMVNPDLERIE